MDSLELVETTLRLARQRQADCPMSATYESVAEQVAYIRTILVDPSAPRDRLKDITIGVIAAKELEDADPELAKYVHKVAYFADQLMHGRDPTDPNWGRPISLYRRSLGLQGKKRVRDERH